MGKDLKEYTWSLLAKKLAGEASSAELRELDELLRTHPDLHLALQTITDIWNPGDEPHNPLIAEQAFQRHMHRMQELDIEMGNKPRAKKVRKILSLSAAVAAACALIAIVLINQKPAGKNQPPAQPQLAGSEIFTANGSRTHIVLPDSTIVWLNAGSRVTYNKTFNTFERVVTLTGEAFFDVAPNASKPFIIHTSHIDIRVLGTAFNVKSYPSDKTTEATLIRGSIEVSVHSRPADKIILKPNEKLVVRNEETLKELDAPQLKQTHTARAPVVIVKPTVEERSGAIIETSWVDNKLIFQDEQFGQLARDMERWYGITIKFEDPAKENLRFTGIFEKETIGQALEALQLTAKFNFKIEGTQITIQD